MSRTSNLSPDCVAVNSLFLYCVGETVPISHTEIYLKVVQGHAPICVCLLL